MTLILDGSIRDFTGLEPMSIEEAQQSLAVYVSQRLDGLSESGITSIFDGKMADFISVLIRRYLSDMYLMTSITEITDHLLKAV